jgi:hypothetical protein
MFESPRLGLGNGNFDALVGNMGPQTATLSPPLVRTGLVVVEIMTFFNTYLGLSPEEELDPSAYPSQFVIAMYQSGQPELGGRR